MYDMEYMDIKRRYNRLSSDDLRREILDRSRSRYNTRKVGAADCMIDSWVIGACREILKERGEEG